MKRMSVVGLFVVVGFISGFGEISQGSSEDNLGIVTQIEQMRIELKKMESKIDTIEDEAEKVKTDLLDAKTRGVPVGTIIASMMPFVDMPDEFKKLWRLADGNPAPKNSKYARMIKELKGRKRFRNEINSNGDVLLPNLRGCSCAV